MNLGLLFIDCLRVVPLYPGFLTPVFATCSTNGEEGLVKLVICLDIGWTYGWKSCFRALYSNRPAFQTRQALPRLLDVEYSIAPLSNVVISSTLDTPTCIYPGMCHSSLRMSPQHLGTSLHMTSSTNQTSPTLVLQVTNTGMRRPEYKTMQNGGF